MAKRYIWTDEADSILGTVPDAEAAKMLGITRHSVSRRRETLGIHAYRERGFASQPFNEWLRDTLKNDGLSQREASKIFDVSLKIIESWIAGPDKSWGRVPSKLEKSGIASLLSSRRGNKSRDEK